MRLQVSLRPSFPPRKCTAQNSPEGKESRSESRKEQPSVRPSAHYYKVKLLCDRLRKHSTFESQEPGFKAHCPSHTSTGLF
ncbi:hypothetical protein I79_022761 [Cricetulus griseus]|uniref:Uncharacterized protein n=1 Tax=Cricetulus griseus TaxID=10029 RepID=G3IG80_CRIGR|nr:hypothetical protein I79_022761 [Cricetulus griseus]